MYEFNLELPLSIDATRQTLERIIAEEKLGIVSEINVQAVALKKTGRDIGPYLILGLCAPDLALQVIDELPNAGTLLPCNVVLRAISDQSTCVSFLSPEAQLGLANNATLNTVAAAAMARLQAVRDRLQ